MVSAVRRYHRWLMLFVGLQFLVWSSSGLYMVLIDIHSIHGETVLNKPQRALKMGPDVVEDADQEAGSIASSINAAITQELIDFSSLIRLYPDASNINLGWLADKPVYRFTSNKARMLVDASTGKIINGISKETAIAIARGELAEPLDLESILLLTDNAPSEIGSRRLPLWQIEFSGFASSTLYISQQSGQIVAVRHNAWRIFDILWRLHIMDYYEGEDINNVLLNVFALSGLLAALSGALLLGFRLFKNEPAEQSE